jgi:hypothetical protein
MMSRLKPFGIAIAIAVLFFSVGYFAFRATQSGSLFDVPEVNWRDLGELDYITGEASQRLKAFDQKSVKVPGFMVPLEDNMRMVTEFLLVPTPQACIHVPPPPPNQMILVRMKKGSEAAVSFGPIWVYGDFKINSVRHLYGESSFTIEATAIEVYK